ncbi:MAG TPA: hypothetical protein VGH63_04020 [Polyangia bacterium]
MRALACVVVLAILPLAAAHADDPGEAYESRRGPVEAFIDVLRLPGTDPAGG